MTFEEAQKKVDEMTEEEIKQLDYLIENPNGENLDKVTKTALIVLPINPKNGESRHDPIGVIAPEKLFDELPEIGVTMILTDNAGQKFLARVLKVGVAYPRKELTARQKRLLEEAKATEKKLGNNLITGKGDPEQTNDAIDILHAAIEDIESGEEYRIEGASELLKALKTGNEKALKKFFKKYGDQ